MSKNQSSVRVELSGPVPREVLERGIQAGLNRIGIHWSAESKKAISAMVYDQPQSPSGYLRTGRLRASITFATPEMQMPTPEWTPPTPPDRTVIVGSNVEYAPYVHEGVMAQEVEVPQHAVREHQRTMTSVFGQEVTPFVVTVRAHTRGPYMMRVPERAPKKFIEEPLLANIDAYRVMLQESIARAFGGAS